MFNRSLKKEVQKNGKNINNVINLYESTILQSFYKYINVHNLYSKFITYDIFLKHIHYTYDLTGFIKTMLDVFDLDQINQDNLEQVVIMDTDENEFIVPLLNKYDILRIEYNKNGTINYNDLLNKLTNYNVFCCILNDSNFLSNIDINNAITQIKTINEKTKILFNITNCHKLNISYKTFIPDIQFTTYISHDKDNIAIVNPEYKINFNEVKWKTHNLVARYNSYKYHLRWIKKIKLSNFDRLKTNYQNVMKYFNLYYKCTDIKEWNNQSKTVKKRSVLILNNVETENYENLYFYSFKNTNLKNKSINHVHPIDDDEYNYFIYLNYDKKICNGVLKINMTKDINKKNIKEICIGLY